MRAGLLLFAMISVAHAQPATAPAGDPGPPAPAAPIAPAAPTPSGAAPAPPGMVPAEPSPARFRRWSVALALGTESMRAKPDDAPTLAVATVELAGRFRLKPAIEFALVLGGGGSTNGSFSTSSIMADFRYRFLADRPLNVYAMAGLGIASAYGKDPTDFEKKGRGAFRIGGGGELRFDALAAFAELRLYGIGENKEVPDPAAPTTRYELARFSVSGVALVLGLTYYF
jgi:hypothetical protein